jgi:hypothetical protein
MRVTLEFVRATTGSVVRVETEKPEGSPPFAFVEGFNHFEIRSETHHG